MDIREFIEHNGGVVGPAQLASYFDIEPHLVTAWAEENGVAIVPQGYAFTVDKAEEFEAEVVEPDQSGEDDEEDDPDDWTA